MANILTLNSANPGKGRPLRLSDLQALWDAIGSLFVAGPQQNTPVILWGFQLQPDNTFSAGALSYGGQLYYYPASTSDKISVGDSVYVDTVPSGDVRVIEGGASQQFSSYNIVTGKESDTSTFLFSIPIAEAVEVFRCAMMMTQGGIPASMLKPGSIAGPQIANGAITGTQIANGAITGTQIANGAVADAQLSQPHKRIGWARLTLSLGTSTVPLSTIVSAGGIDNSVEVSSVRLASNESLGINLDGDFPSFPDIIPLSFHVSSGSATVTLNFSQPVASPTGMRVLTLTASTYIGVTLAKSINGYIPVGTVAF